MLIPWMKRMRPTKVQVRVNQSNPPCKLVFKFSVFLSRSNLCSFLSTALPRHLLRIWTYQKMIICWTPKGNDKKDATRKGTTKKDTTMKLWIGKDDKEARKIWQIDLSKGQIFPICFYPFHKLYKLTEYWLNLRIWANSSFRNRC